MLLSSFAIDGLEILDTQDFEIEAGGIQGLEEPERRVATTINPGGDGGFIPSALYGMRGVSIQGMIRGRGPLGFTAARKALGEVCQLRRSTLFESVLRSFTFTLRDGQSFYFFGQVSRYSAPNLGVGIVKFSISILAPDPLLYDSNSKTSGAIAVPAGGGVIMPTLVPFVRAASSGGRATLTNEGNETASPILTFVGQLTTPYVVNQETGQFMQLTNTILGSDSVTVNMQDNTITAEGGSGLLDAKGEGSDWWGLVPGANPISFSTSNTSDTGYLVIAWNDASVSI